MRRPTIIWVLFNWVMLHHPHLNGAVLPRWNMCYELLCLCIVTLQNIYSATHLSVFFQPPWVTAAEFGRYDVTGSEASTETGWTVASLNCICLSACLSYNCTSHIFWFSCKFHFLASSCKLALGYSRLRVSHPCTQRVRNPYATCSLALQTRTQQAINQHTAAVSQPL